MNPWHLFKAFLHSIPEAFRARKRAKIIQEYNRLANPGQSAKLSSQLSDPFDWKAILRPILVIASIICIGFGAWNLWKTYFADIDHGVVMRKHSSPKVSATMTDAFHKLADECLLDAKATTNSVRFIRMMEISPKLKSHNVWTAVTIPNQGFATLTSSEQGTRQQLISRTSGYYELSGKPISFVVKQFTRNNKKNSFGLSLLFENDPILPKTDRMVIQVTDQEYELKPDDKQLYHMRLGLLPPPNTGIRAHGIQLPVGFAFTRISAERRAIYLDLDRRSVAWINSRLPFNGPNLEVEFKKQ